MLASATGDVPLPLREAARTDAAAASAVVSQTLAPISTQVTAFVLPPNWSAERDEVLRRVAELETALRQIAPLVDAIATRPKRGEIGDNNPPEPIDAAGVQPDDVKEALVTVEVLRDELTAERPRFAVIRLCGASWSASASESERWPGGYRRRAISSSTLW